MFNRLRVDSFGDEFLRALILNLPLGTFSMQVKMDCIKYDYKSPPMRGLHANGRPEAQYRLW